MTEPNNTAAMPPCMRCGETGVVTNRGLCAPCEAIEDREESDRG